MKFTTREGQVVLAGRVGLIDKKTDSMTIVRLAHKKNKEETEWLSIAFCNPQQGQKGQALAALADQYVTKGAYITVVANAVQKDEKYTNYYAVSVELGPRSMKVDEKVDDADNVNIDDELPF